MCVVDGFDIKGDKDAKLCARMCVRKPVCTRACVCVGLCDVAVSKANRAELTL